MCRFYLSTWWFVAVCACADFTFPRGGLFLVAHVQILPFHMVVCFRLALCRFYLSTWWFVAVRACAGVLSATRTLVGQTSPLLLSFLILIYCTQVNKGNNLKKQSTLLEKHKCHSAMYI
jgi:hypothetical protein